MPKGRSGLSISATSSGRAVSGELSVFAWRKRRKRGLMCVRHRGLPETSQCKACGVPEGRRISHLQSAVQCLFPYVMPWVTPRGLGLALPSGLCLPVAASRRPSATAAPHSSPSLPLPPLTPPSVSSQQLSIPAWHVTCLLICCHPSPELRSLETVPFTVTSSKLHNVLRAGKDSVNVCRVNERRHSVF